MTEHKNRFRNMGSLGDAPESARYLRRLNGETASPLDVGRELTNRARRGLRGFRST